MRTFSTMLCEVYFDCFLYFCLNVIFLIQINHYYYYTIVNILLIYFCKITIYNNFLLLMAHHLSHSFFFSVYSHACWDMSKSSKHLCAVRTGHNPFKEETGSEWCTAYCSQTSTIKLWYCYPHKVEHLRKLQGGEMAALQGWILSRR